MNTFIEDKYLKKKFTLFFLIPFQVGTSNPSESKTILFCTIRFVQLRFVQYEIVFDSRVLKQDIVIRLCCW